MRRDRDLELKRRRCGDLDLKFSGDLSSHIHPSVARQSGLEFGQHLTQRRRRDTDCGVGGLARPVAAGAHYESPHRPSNSVHAATDVGEPLTGPLQTHCGRRSMVNSTRWS
jgi:hypothetical protein